MRRTVTQSIVAALAAVTVSAGMLALPATSAIAATPPPYTGGLTQLPGTAGCSETPVVPADGCASGPALGEAGSVAVTSDGSMVYVAGTTDGGSISAFSRDPFTGALTPLPGAAGCATLNGNGGCTKIADLSTVRTILLSPNDKQLYVATAGGQQVLILTRAADGSLSRPSNPTGCVKEGAATQTCTAGTGIPYPYGLALGVDGSGAAVTLYVTSITGGSASGTLAAFDISKGGPVFQSCLQSGQSVPPKEACGSANGLVIPTGVVAVGTNVYVASFGSSTTGAVSFVDASGPVLSETACYGTLTGCTTAPPTRGTGGASDIAVSKDGKNVYVAGYSQAGSADGSIVGGSVAVFTRATTGALSQAPDASGCLAETSVAGDSTCAQGRGLKGAASLAVAADGRQVYVASQLKNSDPSATATAESGSSALVVLDRGVGGALSQPTGADGCVSSAASDSCTVGIALRQPGNRPRSIALTPQGGQVYASATMSNALVTFVRHGADLQLSALPQAGPYAVGQTYNLVLTARNAGPLAAHNVVLTDALSSGGAVVAAAPSQGSCQINATICLLGTLPVGTSASVTVRFQPTASTTVVSTARVRADEGDALAADNIAVTSLATGPTRLAVVSGSGQTTKVGTSFAAPVKASLKDSAGAPLQGVQVTFSAPATGASALFGGARTETVTTDAAGNATSSTPTANNTVGSYAVSIASAGAPSVTATLTNAATPPSPSATPTATISPSAGGRDRLVLDLTSPSTITPGRASTWIGFGTPGQAVTLRCYSRFPANSQPGSGTPAYFDARQATLNSSGGTAFTLMPGTNTRCFLRYADATDAAPTSSDSLAQSVATALSLSAYRDGVRQYHFQGSILPHRSGQLITLYRIDNLGREIRTSTATTDASGIWRINRHFTGSGEFSFRARTSQTLTNAAGVSNTRLTVIH